MKKMKKTFLLATSLLFFIVIYGQVAKPVIMVVPSENWCEQNGFMQNIDNQEEMRKFPDFNKALQTSTELNSVIQLITELMGNRGLPLRSLEAALKNGANSSNMDVFVKEKVDIFFEIDWKATDRTKKNPKLSVQFFLKGIDAATGAQIAISSSNEKGCLSCNLLTLLTEAVYDVVDNFCVDLNKYFLK